jgi:formylglycine-generating enzyme required for sulfatase activity
MIKFSLQVSRPVDAYDQVTYWGILMKVHIMCICVLMGVVALQSCKTVNRSRTKDIGGKPGDVSKAGMTFVNVPAGTFMMGSPDSEGRRYVDEGPQHQVTISKSFELQTTEVTQAQWQAVMGSNPSNFKGPDLPIEQVSWDDAQAFITKLNGLGDVYRYRLPTEAEWEYAARAGTTGPYAGDLDAMAWYEANSGQKTHPVATKAANAWGLYDMHGNVWEWVQDWDGEYSALAVTDPVGPSSGSDRVFRGGAWDFMETDCRSAIRVGVPPGGSFYNVGFRLVRTSP